MAEIKSLSTLAKTSAAANDVLLVTNTGNNSAKKYPLTNLFPSVTTVGSNSESLYVNITNKNQLNYKGIKSATTSMLTASTVSNNISLSVLPAGIDLNLCDNTSAQFTKGVNFNTVITGSCPVSSGGTGLGVVAKGSILYASGANQFATSTMSTHGQLLIGNATTGYPSVSTLTAGTNVTITNAAGAITIAASLGGLTADLDCNAHDINLDHAAGRSFVSGDGTKEGISVDADGKVFIGDSTPSVPTIAGQLHLCGTTANAIVVGNTNDYKAHTITAMTSASGTAGLELTVKGADGGGGNAAGGALIIDAGDGVGNGTGGNLELSAGNGVSGAPGNILLKTFTAGGSRTTALTVDILQGLTVNAGNLVVAAKPLYARSSSTPQIIKYQGTQATTDDGTTVVSAANILTGIVQCTPTTDRSKATDTAANLVSGLSLTADNDAVDWILINLATDGLQNVTLTAGTGVTLVGNMVVHAQDAADNAVSIGTGTFRLRRTGASAITMYRIG